MPSYAQQDRQQQDLAIQRMMTDVLPHISQLTEESRTKLRRLLVACIEELRA